MPGKECFYRSVKDGTTGENGQELDGHINDEDYLTCKKNLEWVEHAKYGWLSRPLFEKRCFVISWLWKGYWDVLKILQAWALSLF